MDAFHAAATAAGIERVYSRGARARVTGDLTTPLTQSARRIKEALESMDAATLQAVVSDLNDPAHACPLTGFLPLHVAVANSLTGMFNFLTDLPGLPLEPRVYAGPETAVAEQRSAPAEDCHPAQTACEEQRGARFLSVDLTPIMERGEWDSFGLVKNIRHPCSCS